MNDPNNFQYANPGTSHLFQPANFEDDD